MKFLALPVVLMFFLTLISVAYVSAVVDSAYSGESSFTVSPTASFGFNGSTDGVDVEYKSSNVTPFTVAVAMTFSNLVGALAAVAVAMALVIGVNVLGSGVSTYSGKVAVAGSVAVLVWGLFSAGAYTALCGGTVLGVVVEGLPYGLGVLIYFGLSMVYSFGVLSLIGGD